MENKLLDAARSNVFMGKGLERGNDKNKLEKKTNVRAKGKQINDKLTT